MLAALRLSEWEADTCVARVPRSADAQLSDAEIVAIDRVIAGSVAAASLLDRLSRHSVEDIRKHLRRRMCGRIASDTVADDLQQRWFAEIGSEALLRALTIAGFWAAPATEVLRRVELLNVEPFK